MIVRANSGRCIILLVKNLAFHRVIVNFEMRR